MILVPVRLDGWYHPLFFGYSDMLIRFIGTFVLILALFATVVVYAKSKSVVCPSIQEIRQQYQAIDHAFYYKDTYGLWPSSYRMLFKKGNLSWTLGVYDVVAGSSDEAIEIAKASIKNTHIKNNEYAYKFKAGPNSEDAAYFCDYGPGRIRAIAYDPTDFDEESDSSPTKNRIVQTPFTR